ncbi:SANTA (SANT associated) domain-containing protein [Ditylenchus destructor]|uniref:SANTA (SANT associated) domain-containing protein n=1 Tax=Ditylenchus destructor TaxID=166010 RepID=A0AAD4RDG1_9BILA|nr:SANTA (SANT associated) domain-containing protein [Ditylenchus destructor]
MIRQSLRLGETRRLVPVSHAANPYSGRYGFRKSGKSWIWPACALYMFYSKALIEYHWCCQVQKTPSKVWLAYRKTPEGPVCNYCGSVRRRKDSSTKTMWDHLDRKHNDVARILRQQAEFGEPADIKNLETLLPSTSTHTTSSASGDAITSDVQALYSTLFQTTTAENDVRDGGMVKSEAVFNMYQTSEGNTLTTFQLPTSTNEGAVINGHTDAKCNINDMMESEDKQSVTINVMTTSIDSMDKSEPVISLVRWKLNLVALQNSTYFAICIQGIRTDTGADFISTEILKVQDARTVKTRSETVKLVGAISPEGIRREYMKFFQEGLPRNWRQLVAQQFNSNCNADLPRSKH